MEGECPGEVRDILREEIKCSRSAGDCSKRVLLVDSLGGRDCLGYLGTWGGTKG